MKSVVIPSAFTPIQDVLVENARIIPHNRIMYKTFNGSSLCNAITVEATSREELERIIGFHAFMTRSERGIFQYDRRNIDMFKYEETEQKALNPSDFADMLQLLYLDIDTESDDYLITSFCEMYSQYATKSTEVLNLVDTFNMHLDLYGRTGHHTLLDYSYWSIVKDYSIVDYLVGEPEPCTLGLFECKCGRKELKHHGMSIDEHLSISLDKIMGDYPKRKADYLEIIKIVRNKIRHRTVHSAVTPRSKYPSSPHTQRYATAKQIAKFEENKYALQGLEIAFHHIVWNLLMNKIFGFNQFDIVRGLSVTTVDVELITSTK